MKATSFEGIECHRAVILTGKPGARLYSFTETPSNRFSSKNSIKILAHTLSVLDAAGLSEVTIVAAHCDDSIRQLAGSRFGDLMIDYVEIPTYKANNSIYALDLGLRSNIADVLVVDRTVVFEAEVVRRLRASQAKGAIAAAAFRAGMTETALRLDSGGYVSAISSIYHPVSEDGPESRLLKTLGIHLFRSAFLAEDLLPAIHAAVAAGKSDLCQEDVLARVVRASAHPMEAVRCDDCRWIEIEDHSDFAAAEALFADHLPKGRGTAALPVPDEAFEAIWRAGT